MKDLIYRPVCRQIITALFVTTFLFLTPIAADADEGADKTAANTPATVPLPAPLAPPERQEDAKSATISYAVFANALKVGEEAPATQPVGKFNLTAPALPVTPNRPAPAPQTRRVATAPLSVGEKFELFWRGSFVPFGPYASALFSGFRGELFDNNEGKKDTFDDYVADSLTRSARSFAFSATSKFFEKFMLPSLLRQDPRYHRSGKDGTGARLGYAISRIFVTRSDKGNNQPNVSFLLGGAMASAVANVWEREERQTVKKSLTRWSSHIMFSMFSNIFREFLGGQ